MATNPRFDLTNRTVIITGGGKGIGKVYAQEFARVGARVVAADIDELLLIRQAAPFEHDVDLLHVRAGQGVEIDHDVCLWGPSFETPATRAPQDEVMVMPEMIGTSESLHYICSGLKFMATPLMQ